MGSRVAGNWSEEGDPRILAPEGSQERGCARVICRTYFVSRHAHARAGCVVLCVKCAMCEYIRYSIYLRAEIGRSSARRPRRPGAGRDEHTVARWCDARARRGATQSRTPQKFDLIYRGSDTGNCPIPALTAPRRPTDGVTDVRGPAWAQLTQWMPGFWSSGRSEWRLPHQPSSVWLGCRRSASSSPPRPRRSNRAP